MGRYLGLLAVVTLFAASTADAQVLNPTTVEFQVSPDHNVTVLGTAVVTSYEMRIFAEGATAPMTTATLGKPTAANDATVSINKAEVLAAIPVGSYFAKVAAIGPGGEGVSDPSNPFGRLSSPRAARSLAVR